MTLFGTGVRNYLRAVRKGLRTSHAHNQCVGFKRNAVSVYQDLSPSPQPSPKGRGSLLSPLSQRARESLVSPLPLGEGRGGEGNLVVALKS